MLFYLRTWYIPNTKDSFFLNFKDSNLCVPISVTTLIRHALRYDLKIDDAIMTTYYSTERIVTCLAMIVFPRSLAGLNFTPNKEEKEFQYNSIEHLLKRLKFSTYLNENGWKIIKSIGVCPESEFCYKECKFSLSIQFYFIYIFQSVFTQILFLPDPWLWPVRFLMESMSYFIKCALTR